MGRVGELDVVVRSPGADLVAFVDGEVVEHECEPCLSWVAGADLVTEGEELDSGLALFDFTAEEVVLDVEGAEQVTDAVRAGVGGADPAGPHPWRPRLAARLRLQVERPELVQADDHVGVVGPGLRDPVGDRVQLQDPVLLGLEAGVVGALPAPHGLKADAFLAKQLAEPLVGDVVDHPLGDQIVGELGQAPSRKWLAEVGRDAERDLLDLLPLRQREGARTAAPVARIQGVKAVAVEVVDHLAHRVRIAEHHLREPRRRHPLRREQHNLGSPPGHDRAAAATNDPQQPVALLVADLAELHARRHCPLPSDHRSGGVLRRRDRGPSIETGKRCRSDH